MTHPGDFTDTPVEQDLVTASSVAWERPVREVSLSARADTIADMADVWQTYVTGLGGIADQLNRIWTKDLADNWTGDAANACRAKWNDILNKFSQVMRNYSESGSAGTGVPGLLRDTATAIHDAIGAIPIPVFGSTTANGAVLPNTTTVTKDNDSGWGDQLYADYAAGPHSYEDRAFLKIAESGATEQRNRGAYGDIPAGSRVRPNSASEYDVGDSHQSTTNYQARQDGTYPANVQAWYISNQRLAHTSYNTLLNTYAHHQTAVPDAVLRDKHHDAPRATPPHGTGPTGTGTAFTGTTGTGTTSAPLPATTRPDVAMPTSDAGSAPGATPSPSSGLSGVGGSTSVGGPDQGLGVVAGPDLGTSSGFGGGDVGSVAGVGFSPGSGTPPGEGAGVAPDPLGRVGSGTGVAGEGLPSTRNPSGSPGMGMMGPGYGGSGDRERDESRSWLTEDEDVWGLYDKPDMTPPDGII